MSWFALTSLSLLNFFPPCLTLIPILRCKDVHILPYHKFHLQMLTCSVCYVYAELEEMQIQSTLHSLLHANFEAILKVPVIKIQP